MERTEEEGDSGMKLDGKEVSTGGWLSRPTVKNMKSGIIHYSDAGCPDLVSAHIVKSTVLEAGGVTESRFT